MTISYLRNAIRNLWANKGFTLISIIGFSIGMACSIVIYLWVANQLSFDQSQINRDRIYRLESGNWALLPQYYGKVIEDIPEVESVVRFHVWARPTLKYENNLLNTENFVFADSSFFNVFNFEFISGTRETSLKTKNSLVLTENYARMIFGNENPLGKVIKYDNRIDFMVTGILKNPDKFQVKFNALAPFHFLREVTGRKDFFREKNWNYLTYLLLSENCDPDYVEKKINEKLSDFVKDEVRAFLRPFNEIYFAKNIKHEKGVLHGNRQLVILFSIIAFFILLIACVNFINLSTTRAGTRAKEISVRKVVGADRVSLISQFLIETSLILVISLVLALFITSQLLPFFEIMAGEYLSLKSFNTNLIILAGAGLLFFGLVAGIIPAIYLSSIKPVVLFKGLKIKQVKNFSWRNVLIIFQFSIAIFLIIGSFAVYRQLNYMKDKNLGFNSEQIINIRLKGSLLNEKKEIFRGLLTKCPDILQVSYSGQVHGNITNTHSWTINGEKKPMKVLLTDPYFIETMDLELVGGRNFSPENTAESGKKYIINEEAVRHLKLKQGVGEIVKTGWGDNEIIGVVKDYHFNSLHNKIGPLALVWQQHRISFANIRISGHNTGKTIEHIRKTWTELCPEFPFEYAFLDETFARQYNQEYRLSMIMKYFVFLALFLASLGLFGLSGFLISQRIKEIGIRKVLGSSNSGIVVLLSREISFLVILSNVIAWPVAWWLISQWLNNFAYRTSISILTFVSSALIVLAIAFLTVAYHSFKAVSSKPVEILRYE